MASERALLTGGCFWGMQGLIRKRAGVTSTRAGSLVAKCRMRPIVIMVITLKGLRLFLITVCLALTKRLRLD